MANTLLINQEEVERKLTLAKAKLEKVSAKYTNKPAGRSGAQTTLISAGKVWAVTSLVWSDTKPDQPGYISKGKAIMVRRPAPSANPTTHAAASQKLAAVIEAAFEGYFTKTIVI